jgi:hypothetical protein
MLYRRGRVLFFCMEVEQPEWLQHIGILLPAAPNEALFQDFRPARSTRGP